MLKEAKRMLVGCWAAAGALKETNMVITARQAIRTATLDFLARMLTFLP